MSILCSVTSEEKKAEATAMILVLPCATNSVLPSSSRVVGGFYCQTVL